MESVVEVRGTIESVHLAQTWSVERGIVLDEGASYGSKPSAKARG
jgi:hypothetical protein